MSVSQTFLPETEIEVVNPNITLGRVKHILFDFDGTISLLREGWQNIMGPMCVEMICGEHEPTAEIEKEVAEMIEETTGIQTIFQMQRLVQMVRAHGLVPEDKILDEWGYKAIYNERLLIPVRERIRKLQNGELTIEQVTVRNVLYFLEELKKRGVIMYVFSGTDREDVRHEASVLGVDSYFEEIWGALPSIEEYSKEKVIREIIAVHNLHGPEVMAIGDGPVELRNVKEQGGIALGVASDEKKGYGWDMHKRQRLLRAGADILIPDYHEADKIIKYIFCE
ncbi:MAG TPA: HAD family hydrolase [Candidatus Hydrogenedens sp.]|nr:HAD family hydrolase [Candidatus Hydrogenedens sp.]HOK10153.1 HAD family hydrolase [Candidatus Hydrogenedens sp.]HOL19420.1 HAD family hydrolase [Candidatus Hydrogenedens sp.]HPP58249.1 HAD family hydrolase [Candidatus Hydrogenedens sp.]